MLGASVEEEALQSLSLSLLFQIRLWMLDRMSVFRMFISGSSSSVLRPRRRSAEEVKCGPNTTV
jgi:hypothetical protein